jgi:(2Fe-2S) ferredoxin
MAEQPLQQGEPTSSRPPSNSVSTNAAPADAPIQAPYARHLFFCAGRYCDPEGKAVALYNRLPRLLGELGAYDNPERVKRGLTPCLGVCYGGPLLVVYPEGIWYHHVDDALLERIVQEHLVEGRPVEEAIFLRLSDNPAAP